MRVQSEKLVVRYDNWALPIRTFLQRHSFDMAKHFEDCFDATRSYVLLSRIGTNLTTDVWRDFFVKEFVSLIEMQKQLILNGDEKYNFRKLNFFCFKNLAPCNIPVRFNSRLIFTIMPFSDIFIDVYEVGIKPVVESFDLISLRADEILQSGDILCGSICQPIQECRFLIADLSGRNPNVFYELGIAHGFEKEIILMSNNINDVPFDLRGMNILLYKNVSEVKKKLPQRIQLFMGSEATQSPKLGNGENKNGA